MLNYGCFLARRYRKKCPKTGSDRIIRLVTKDSHFVMRLVRKTKTAADATVLSLKLYECDARSVLYAVVESNPYYVNAADGFYQGEAFLVGHTEEGG